MDYNFGPQWFWKMVFIIAAFGFIVGIIGFIKLIIYLIHHIHFY